MPINYENFCRTIRFGYTNERDSNFALDFEFHHTEDFGPTLTIHNLESGPLSLPFSAYSEAVDAIRNEGMQGNVAARPIPAPARPSTSTRLQPTRVANTVQPVRSAPVRRPQIQTPVEQEMEPQQEYPQPMQGPYMDQGVLLTSDGVAESFAAPQSDSRPRPRPQPPQAQSRRPPQEVPPPQDIDDGDPVPDESLPPEMSLRNGRLKRQSGLAAAGAKRIRKLEPIPDHGQR